MPATGIKALSEEWFDIRQNRITATDVPVILGVGGFASKGSILDVWGRITRKMPPAPDNDVTPEMTWGNDSEGLNAKLFSREAGREVEECGELFRHPHLDFLFATPDYWQLVPVGDTGDRVKGVLECKAPTKYTRADWDEAVPLAYQVQTLVQMMCTGVRAGSVSALIPPGVAWADIQGAEVLIAKLERTLERFWEENVIGGKEPDVKVYRPEFDLAALKRLHPDDDGSVIELDADLAETADLLQLCRQERLALEKSEKKLQAQIIQAIGSATYAHAPGVGFSYKTQEAHYQAKDAYMQKSRVLRFVKNIPGVTL